MRWVFYNSEIGGEVDSSRHVKPKSPKRHKANGIEVSVEFARKRRIKVWEKIFFLPLAVAVISGRIEKYI